MISAKRPFLLLELLIALALVALCAIPLIAKPVLAYLSELQNLEEEERIRLADWTFSEIKEQMYKNTIPWTDLPGLKETKGPFFLNASFIQIPGKEPKRIERSFTFYGKGEKFGADGEIFRMIHVKIELTPPLSKKKNNYNYRTIAKKTSKDFLKT